MPENAEDLQNLKQIEPYSDLMLLCKAQDAKYASLFTNFNEKYILNISTDIPVDFVAAKSDFQS